MKLPTKTVAARCHKQDLSKDTHTLTVCRVVLAAEPHVLSAMKSAPLEVAAVHCSSQLSTAVHSYPLQSTAVHCSPQLFTAVHSCLLQSTAIHCSPQLSTAVHSYPLQSTTVHCSPQLSTAVHSCPLQSTAVHCSPQRRLPLINLHFEMSPSQSPYRYVISCFR